MRRDKRNRHKGTKWKRDRVRQRGKERGVERMGTKAK
jgi:hypothetical protein